jgi:hypothetical protein
MMKILFYFLSVCLFLVSVVMNVVLLVTVKNSTSLSSDTDSVLLANISLANIILGEYTLKVYICR